MTIVKKLGLLLCLTFATACAVDGEIDGDLETQEIESASEAARPGKFGVDLNQLGWTPISKDRICKSLEGVTYTVTTAGCTTTTTLSNCSYNDSTGGCHCSSSSTRTGTGC